MTIRANTCSHYARTCVRCQGRRSSALTPRMTTVVLRAAFASAANSTVTSTAVPLGTTSGTLRGREPASAIMRQRRPGSLSETPHRSHRTDAEIRSCILTGAKPDRLRPAHAGANRDTRVEDVDRRTPRRGAPLHPAAASAIAALHGRGRRSCGAVRTLEARPGNPCAEPSSRKPKKLSDRDVRITAASPDRARP